MTQETVLKPIVVAVDFSQESESALLAAAGLADTTLDTPIVILHVVHEPAHKPGFYDRRGRGDSILPLEYLARHTLTGFMTKMRRQYPVIARLQNVQEEIVDGLPETRIPERARQLDAQLIILGCTGRGALSRLCYGSVSDKVKQRSNIPVKIVHLNGAGGEEPRKVEDSDTLRKNPQNAGDLPNQLGLG
jgi:nucleotide-binding universal stress UspA family protein